MSSPRDSDDDEALPEAPEAPEAIEVPIDGTLDLHTFHPRELGELVPAYLEECHARGIFSVRLVHGKGTGALRRSVHAILERLPAIVVTYRLGDEAAGGWGATLVELDPAWKPPAT
ncbi:MAG: Smr/MutS family protein [Deltaproteobacteria bacterium]|nr:Smr/MutS family protein [Deltaproteobacteria bacterium]